MVHRRVGGGHCAWPCLSVSKFGCAVQLSPVALSCSIRGGKRSPPGDLLQAPGDGLCPELCGRACLQGPERPSWPALLPQPRNSSPTPSMAGSGCWGQSSQGLCLPQAFQELSSEVTVTVLVSEENILVRASHFWELEREWGMGAWSSKRPQPSWLCRIWGNQYCGHNSPSGANWLCEDRTCGGRLSWPHTLAGPRGIQGGATGI